jgi:hypothetical protein
MQPGLDYDLSDSDFEDYVDVIVTPLESGACVFCGAAEDSPCKVTCPAYDFPEIRR